MGYPKRTSGIVRNFSDESEYSDAKLRLYQCLEMKCQLDRVYDALLARQNLVYRKTSPSVLAVCQRGCSLALHVIDAIDYVLAEKFVSKGSFAGIRACDPALPFRYVVNCA